jgi:hypothetical protein
MADRQSTISVKWLLEKLWRWEVVGVGSTLLYGFGVGAMYADDYLVARCLYSAGLVWLIAKTLAWEETRRHQNRKAVSAGILVTGLICFGLSELWIQHRKSGQHETAATDTHKSVSATTNPPDVPPDIDLTKRPYFRGKAFAGYFIPLTKTPTSSEVFVLDVFIKVTIVNQGIPSAAGGWSVDYLSPTVQHQVFNHTDHTMDVGYQQKNGAKLTFLAEDSIYEKMAHASQTGDPISGWARFQLPGYLVNDIDNALMTINYRDYLDYEYTIAYRPGAGHAPTTPLGHSPGMHKPLRSQSGISEQLARAQLSQLSLTELVNKAQTVAKELRDFKNRYMLRDDNTALAYNDPLQGTGHLWSDQTVKDWIAREKQERAELREQYENEGAVMLNRADDIRAEIIRRTIPHDLTERDEVEVLRFKIVEPYGQMPFVYSFDNKAEYLERLAYKLTWTHQ